MKKKNFIDASNNMTRDEAISFMKENPGAKVTHATFAEYEYLYADESGFIYDENDYLFEDWLAGSYRSGLRARVGSSWEAGWSPLDCTNDVGEVD